MSYLIVSIIAFVISFLTLFSGFGLSTVLMPVFAIFFPLPLAVAAAAVVHLATNILKLFLLGKNADKNTVIKFGIPAALAAIGGAFLLKALSNFSFPLFTYTLFSHKFDVTLIGLTIGILVILFSFFEFLPKLASLALPKQFLIPGGILSGFFGGLSGHQGMLRGAFLIKVGLSKIAFIATSVVCSLFVDIPRVMIYTTTFYSSFVQSGPEVWKMVACATGAAFLGAYLAFTQMKKVTLKIVQYLVGIMLLLLGIALSFGII